MWIYIGILKILWVDKIRNEEVLRKRNPEMELLLTIKKKKPEYLVHIMCNVKYDLLQLIIQDKL